MKIYINNEEVVCSQKMTIKESLKNTSSVILNNVYPKSWETDKDYVSRFYMPKDYSHCIIEGDEKPIEEKDYLSKANIVVGRRIENDKLAGSLGDTTYSMYMIPVIPGQTYKIIATATQSEKVYECLATQTNIFGTTFNTLGTLQIGENTIEVTPTEEYILINHELSSAEVVDITAITTENNFEEKTIGDNGNKFTDRYIVYATNTIWYSNAYPSTSIAVIPGKTYYITLKSSYTNTGLYLNETDSTNIGTVVTRNIFIYPGTKTYVIKPTKKYLIFGSSDVEIVGVKIVAEKNVLFSGIVKNSGNINLNPRYPHYATLQLLDYKAFLSEGDTLNYVLESQTVEEAAKKILYNLKGFMLGTFKTNNYTIPAYNCNEKTPYDVFEYLAEVTNSIWFTEAVDDELILIHFYNADNLEQADNIEYTQEYFTDHNIEDIKYSYSANDYRNKQVITNDEATANIAQIENIEYTGNNIKTNYPISYIASIKSGTKNYSFTSDAGKSAGRTASFYYKYNSNEIEVGSNIGTGNIFEITYYPIVTTRQIVFNQDEIDRIAETNRDGTITRYEKRTDTNSEEMLSQIAQTYLDFKGIPEITLTVKSYYMDILDIGQKVFFNGPLDDLKTNYLVTDKQIEMTTTADQQVIFYTYKLSSSFNAENAINFFDNQRRKLEGNIEEGEYISRYVDIPSQTNIIFYDLSTQNIDIPNDILDGILDIELIGGSTNKLNAKLNFKL